MSRVRMRSHLFLIMILLVFMTSTPVAFAYVVEVTNNLSSNNKPLVMHCWSHDDDLGVHTLWNSQGWDWKFGQKFLGRTHFLCEMKHDTKEKTIDVFDSNNERLSCDISLKCSWSVRDDGFYFDAGNYKGFFKIYEW
ncbi:hypothetical protein ACOSQ4_006472 [Xanthoceras sorbifolium]